MARSTLAVTALGVVLCLVASRAGAEEAAVEVGDRYLAVAAFEDAAAAYARFARQSPADPRAPRALVDAIRLHVRLGARDKAAAELGELERAFAEPCPEAWAEAVFVVSDEREERADSASAVALLRGLLEVTDRLAVRPRSGRAPAESRLVLLEIELRARVRLARSLAALQDHHGADAETRRALGLARDLLVGPTSSPLTKPPKSPETVDLVAEARFASAEHSRHDAERLALVPYRGAGDRESIHAYVVGPVTRWFEARRAAVLEAERAYGHVLGVALPRPPPPPRPAPPGILVAAGDPDAPTLAPEADPFHPAYAGRPPPSPRWAIAAAERVGRLWGEIARLAGGVPVLRGWPSAGAEAAYLLTLVDSPVDRVKARAKDAFSACARLARDHRIADERARACEAWLAQNYRAEFRPLDELASPPDRVAQGLFAPALPAPRAPRPSAP